jgi:hypothetical protein
MADVSKAWIWEHYQRVVVNRGNESTGLWGERVILAQIVEEPEEDSMDQRSNEARFKFGAAIAISVVAGAFFPMVALVLFLIAALLIASSKEPTKTAEILGNTPGGEKIAKALNHVDKWLS